MANPTNRHSRCRRNRRRSHDALRPANLSPCPQCGEPRLPHRVCKHCGHYRGRRVLTPKEEI